MQHLAVCALMVMAAGCESLRAGRCASHGPAVVTTTQGKVAGIMEKSTKGKSFWSYYGIPYAKPPIGQLRLRDPLPAEPWGGLRNGSEVSQPCLQVPFFVAVAGIRLPPQQLVGTEDCLYLNVFTPTQLTSIKELPVMVFIPGGGFFAGGNLEYLPHVLLNHDIILVVLQYRLGILGFLSTEDYIVPGNLGLKDQTLALQWVQNNIHSFGGDPNSVTIFGESAGGASVHYHILSPKSRGTRSGSGEKEWSITPLPLGPRVDGDFIPAHPALLIRDHQYNPVDILTGTTAHEGLLVGYPLFGQTNLQESLLKNFSYVGPLSLMCCDGSTDPLTITQRVYTYYLGGLNFSLETQKDQIIRSRDFLSSLPTVQNFILFPDKVTSASSRSLPPPQVYY
nr:LOW QUALITY PROTEIN: juvenile hormone esterase-like [Cherax quadricarinatus]